MGTTCQNLNLWFDSWEGFLIEYRLANLNASGELGFEAGVASLIINMDKMCIFLEGNKGIGDDGLP
jgi:hypothetical protein